MSQENGDIVRRLVEEVPSEGPSGPAVWGDHLEPLRPVCRFGPRVPNSALVAVTAVSGRVCRLCQIL